MRVPVRTGELTDTAGIIPPRNERTIVADLATAQARAGARIEVLTIASLNDWDAEPYGLDALVSTAFDTWNLGDPIRHDGALLVILREPSSAIVITGPWYRGSTDAAIGRVIDATLRPAVARREYTRGIRESVQEIARILSLPVPVPDSTASKASDPIESPGLGTSLPDVDMWTYGLLIVPIALGVGWALRRRRCPHLSCPQCGNRSQPASGPVDADVTIDGGEPVEPWLGSVGVRLSCCVVCGHHVVSCRPKHRSACPSCARRLPTLTLADLRCATSDEPGAVRVSRSCPDCDYRQDRVLSLPRLTQGGRVGASHLQE